jgi:type II secretory pathway pseudopilin PulG
MKTYLDPTWPTTGASAGAVARAAGPGARRGIRARGLGLIEMMLAMAISAAVLTAVATALDVSFRSYAVNQENTILMHRARLAMHRITTDIRTTTAHTPPLGSVAEQDFKAGRIATADSIVMLNDAGEQMSYSFDSANRLLMCIDSVGNEYVASRGVTDSARR